MSLRRDPVVPMARVTAALHDHCAPTTPLQWMSLFAFMTADCWKRGVKDLHVKGAALRALFASWAEGPSGNETNKGILRVRAPAFLVCTVGQVTVKPGASNVIAGVASMTLDIRSDQNSVRQRVVRWINGTVSSACAAEGVACSLQLLHEADAVTCDKRLTVQLQTAASSIVELPAQALAMPSGAGHDAMALAGVAPIALLFVRCKDGLSHTPEEFASRADVGVAVRVLLAFLQQEVLV
jgi:acetylornithine deacetylase/succinyl-diaminopimelate desuccinylase-like protein